MIGLLSHEPTIKKRFPAGAFTAGSGTSAAKVNLCITSTFEEIRLKGNPGKRVVLIPDF